MGKETTKKRAFQTIEGSESELISLAVDEAKKRLREGSASSQIITTVLQWASSKYQLEKEKIRKDNALSDAKVKQIESQEKAEEVAREAIAAMRRYTGYSDDEDDDYD